MPLGDPLFDFDPDTVRVALERELFRRLTRELGDLSPTSRDYEEVRRDWFWSSELLPDAQQARAQRLARTTRERLGVLRSIELFQKAGSAHKVNATTHRSSDGPMLVQLQGAFLERLDDDGVIAVLGHEIGHHLAHGPQSVSGIDPFFLYWRLVNGRRAGYRELAAAYCRAAELTADRVGLLACRNVEAVVRMESVLGDRTWDTVDATARLKRHREYAEGLGRSRRRGHGDSHPEEAVRVYAAWLFSESDVYRDLTGLGPGTRPIAGIDATLSRLVGPAESAEDMGLPPDGELPLVDRARDAISSVRQRASETVATTVRGWVTGATPAVAARPNDGAAELAEFDRDPLEERFAALERHIEEQGRDDRERQFRELERGAGENDLG